MYDLSSPYDISSCSQSSKTTNLDSSTFTDSSKAGTFSSSSQRRDHRLQGVEINNDGTKLFLLFYDEADANIHGRLYEYNLSTPYDVSTLSLVTSAGIELSDTATEVDNPAAVRFSPNGKRLFIVSHFDSDASDRGVTQITLSNPFDTSSFVVDGKLVIFDTMSYNNSQPRGIAFNSSGLKMYLTKDRSSNPDAGDDQIIELSLIHI